ncbi:MAG: hypothetical protein ABIO05_07695 [Ferruginibacter sp.]
MKRFFSFLFFLMFLFPAYSQKILYSDIIKEDNREINFEILGKVGSNYIIYKNVRWKHMLAVYNEQMKLISNHRLSFIPEKTFNIDFITNADHFYVVYQYQKKNIIYCKAAMLDAKGEKLTEPVLLDTSRVGIIADKKIYNTVFSEDKKNILVYKMQRKNDNLLLVTKLYNSTLSLLDSTREILPFDDRKDVYSDLFIDNEGTVVFTKGYKTGWRDNITRLEMGILKPLASSIAFFEVPLQDNFIDEVKIKIDNLNKRYIVNSLFFKKKSGNIAGLFTMLVNPQLIGRIHTAFNFFSDSLRTKINSDAQFSAAFNELFLRNTIVKKDGGFVLMAEDFSSQLYNNNSNFRRYNNLYNSPYASNYDYYLNSPSYNNFYRPNIGYAQRMRYFYDDILILDLDSTLKLNWNVLIHKKQEDEEQDNFLSYATFNAGAEIHFLFSGDKSNQVINNHSILPTGEIKRYATLKSYEAGYEFMPKLAKQVGARQVIIPSIYRGLVAFAKVDFSEAQ